MTGDWGSLEGEGKPVGGRVKEGEKKQEKEESPRGNARGVHRKKNGWHMYKEISSNTRNGKMGVLIKLTDTHSDGGSDASRWGYL